MKSPFNKSHEDLWCNRYINALQQKWTDKMTILTKDLSKRCLVFSLVLFIVLCGSFFLYNILSVFKSNGLKPLVAIDESMVVRDIYNPKSRKNDAVSEEELEEYKAFKAYLDSIRRNSIDKIKE